MFEKNCDGRFHTESPRAIGIQRRAAVQTVQPSFFRNCRDWRWFDRFGHLWQALRRSDIYLTIRSSYMYLYNIVYPTIRRIFKRRLITSTLDRTQSLDCSRLAHNGFRRITKDAIPLPRPFRSSGICHLSWWLVRSNPSISNCIAMINCGLWSWHASGWHTAVTSRTVCPSQL